MSRWMSVFLFAPGQKTSTCRDSLSISGLSIASKSSFVLERSEVTSEGVMAGISEALRRFLGGSEGIVDGAEGVDVRLMSGFGA
jgi:hypothetical protein